MELIEYFKILFIGIVQGITEWLPVSSTGHMILVDEFVKLNQTPEFMEIFLVIIQFGSILAVVYLFWEKLFPFKFKDGFEIKQETMSLWFKVLVGCIPAGIIGILFDDMITEHFYNPMTVAIMLIVYGILFIIIENMNKGRKPKYNELSDITYRYALLIGLFQVLALIPGTSRSGATIVGGLLIGSSRYVVAEFTFFLAIPVMLGASLLKVLKFGLVFTQAQLLTLGIGMLVAFAVSVWAIKFLMGYIKKNDFKVFGYYRIVLGILVILYFTMFA